MNDDIHALTGAFVVDAVDDIERAAFERHLDVCAACREEVASLRATAHEMALLIRVTPPASLRDQVLRDISAVRPLPPQLSREAGARIEAGGRVASEPAVPAPGRHATRSRRSSRWLVAAAAVVALGGGASVVALHPWDRTSQSQVTLTDRVQQAPDAQRYSQTLSDGGSVTVVRSKSVGRAVLVTDKMASAPSGETYQMWLKAAGGNFVSAGLVPGAGSQTVLLDGDAATSLGAGVSVEPAGGSPQPTKPIALFSFA